MKKGSKMLLCAAVCTVLGGAMTSFAGEWKADEKGYWYANDNGGYAASEWVADNGKWYYLGADGYMVCNAWIGNYYVGPDGAMQVSTITPDGYLVGADGAWIQGNNTAAGQNIPYDYTFTDRNGNSITVPKAAFASQVISFTHGSPWTNYAEQQKTEKTLGIPDRVGNDDTSKGDLCLGSGGVLTLAFDLAIYDGEGNDIYVFEVGDQVEDTMIEVSDDLIIWYSVGTVSGSTAGLDLNGKVPAGSSFHYVRLTDMKKYSGTRWPGADIDAVCGVNVMLGQ